MCYCHDHTWLCCCCGFWALGGAEQVSRKSGIESGLLLPSDLFLVCPHQDTVLRLWSCRSNQPLPGCLASPVVNMLMFHRE